MKKRKSKIVWTEAPDVKNKAFKILKKIDVGWINKNDVFFFRSLNSSSKAYARIWGLSRIWQIALNTTPKYIIEVISEKYDKQNDKVRDEILIHELAHIPRNFSGSLLPHIKKRGKRNFHDRVKKLIIKI